jgi:S-formylglutathione hydrolase FrmB
MVSSQTPVSEAATPGFTEKILKVPSPEKDFPIRNVYVLTPIVPASQVDLLPVVYMLHGWPGSPSGLIAGVEGPLAAAFAKGAAPFIAVFPDGNATTHSDSEWADSFDGRAMIETWLTTDVIAAVEGGNRRSRDDRALLGFSMGGYGAAIIALHHPQLFGQVVTLAGYFLIDDLTNAFGPDATSAKKHAFQTPANYLKVAPRMRWFLGESNQDYTLLIRGQAAAWAKKLESVRANYATSSASGGHSYVFVTGEIPSVLKWFKWGVVTPPIATPSALPANSQSATPSPTLLVQ